MGMTWRDADGRIVGLIDTSGVAGLDMPLGPRRYKAAEAAGSAAKKPKSYEFAVDEKTGTLYLKQYRSPFWGELPYVSALVITVMFALLSCCRYIKIRTAVECRMRQTNELQSEYWTLKNENILREKETAQISNLDKVYEIATEELGMVPVQKAHVLIYERTNSEFVYQTDNIPNIVIH